jgi:hypothetical protein
MNLKEAILFIITDHTEKKDCCFPEDIQDIFTNIYEDGVAEKVTNSEIGTVIAELKQEEKIVEVDDDLENPYLIAVRRLYTPKGQVLVSLTISDDEIPDDVEWSHTPYNLH